MTLPSADWLHYVIVALCVARRSLIGLLWHVILGLTLQAARRPMAGE